MKSIQLDINQPIPNYENSPDDFNELKESCGIPTTSYPVNPTSTGTPPPATSSCVSSHTAAAGDTMNSIAKSLSVSTDRLLTYNGFPLSFNDTLVAGEKLCLDQVSKCLIHQVAETDTCASLKRLAGTTVDELMLQSWNPTIGTSCANIKTMVGKYLCIGPPGQDGQFTPVVPTTTPPSITTPTETYTWGTAPDTVTSTVNITSTWLFPTDPSLIPTETPTLPTGDNSAAIEERLKWCPFNNELNDTIWDAGLGEEEYHLHSWDLDDECMLESWEPYCTPALETPVLPSPTDIPSSCLPTVTKIIPEGWVDPPGPTESGVNDDCNKWHLLQNMDTCKSISVKYKITEAQLKEYNPSINAQCGNIRAGFAICVRVWEDNTTTLTPSPTTTSGPPGPTGTGTSPTCKKWHLMIDGDSCDSIATKYGILVSRFRQLNRNVDASCDNLVKGNAYCVG
ncbi:hypothetical protein N7456_007382 [Penicillium angulare]|uniref:LysM domain-containing protein n=1 Tax=Penicillium angulare TaxID=116970 RepID=A0A9W9K8Q5_9EURO|nr:hypothetical protein N7456_007382 [Penicillium angulare]